MDRIFKNDIISPKEETTMNETKTPITEYPNIDKDFWEQIKKDMQEINKE